jgi:hypothetical protein
MEVGMPQKPNDLLKLFLIWAIANILGICTAAIIPFFIAPLVKSIHSVVVSLFIFAVPISLAQWLALRRISHTSILWVLTVPVGILIYFFILEHIPDGLIVVDDESIAALTAAYLMIGFAVGLLQWFILRRQFSGSSLWILGSTVGFGFSVWFLLVTNLINRSGFISLVLGVLVYIIITGLILLRLITHHNHSDTSMTNQT